MLKHNSPRPTTLIHISGGMDSTLTAYQHLMQHPEQLLLLHHVNLYHPRENRVMVEHEAVKNILDWFTKNTPANFIYHESVFSYGTLPLISVKDIQIISFFSGIIIRKYKSITTIKSGWHAREVHPNPDKRGHRVKAILQALNINHIQLEFPIKDLLREQVAKSLPLPLLEMCRCCRNPGNTGPCHTCITCRELIENNLEPQ